MIEKPYIKVAVCLPVMHLYTYGMPDHLKAACCPGMRVLVPFGKVVIIMVEFLLIYH
jgi:primosomal protein N' (replication factor Y)